jgi:hypothetical protein
MPRIAFLLLLSLAISASAQEKKEKKEPAPKVLYAMPLVVKPGAKQKLALRGKGLAAVKDVTITGAEGAVVKVLGAKAVAVANNHPAERVGDSEVEIELDLPKDAKPGAVKLTVVGLGGESNAYGLFIRDSLPVNEDKEPNDGFNQAQVLSVPAAVEGTIRGERDVDVFRFEGNKGDRVRIVIEASRFGSPLDAIVTLHDSQRAILASSDDIAGATHSDPEFVLALPNDGTYYISLIDAHDHGGASFGYRVVVRTE